MSDPETIRIYDAEAARYAEVTDAANAADPRLTAFIAACAAGCRVLDLGCGPGKSAARMAEAGLTVDATDASAEMVAMAARHPGVTARQATFDEIAGEGIYGGVWANFSLLHAPRADMPRHLAALHRALLPGGVLHIAVKTGTGEKRDKLGRYYTYYTDEELTGLLSAAGFTVIDRQTGCDTGLDGQAADWLALRARA